MLSIFANLASENALNQSIKSLLLILNDVPKKEHVLQCGLEIILRS